MEKCAFKEVCTKVPCEGASCIRFLEYHKLLELSKIPKAYIPYKELEAPDKDWDAYDRLREIQDNILDFVNEGKSIYLWSKNCGNAKTTWATKLLKAYFGKVWAGNAFRRRGYFIHVPSFLQRLKDNISERNDILEIKEAIRTSDMVVWDDLAVKAVSEYELEVLLSLLDERISSGKSNIVTGNSNRQTMEAMLGKRITSRIFSSVVIEFKGKDMRGL